MGAIAENFVIPLVMMRATWTPFQTAAAYYKIHATAGKVFLRPEKDDNDLVTWQLKWVFSFIYSDQRCPAMMTRPKGGP